MISVIVATRFASEALELLLDSLIKYQKFDNEIIVIADTPSWQTLYLLQEKKDFTHGGDSKHRYYIVNYRHLEMNWNYGADFATYDYLAFTNDDVVVGPDWDEAIINTMANSKRKIVFLPQYQFGIKSDPNYRDFGSPEWKNSEWAQNMRKSSLGPFNWEKFEKEIKNMQIYGDKSVFWCLHKELFNLAHRYTFSAPHPLGNEIAMMDRCVKIHNAITVMTKSSGCFHWSSLRNTDAQVTSLEISNGFFECSVCKHRDPGVETDLFGQMTNSRVHLDTGLYLCERCKKDGYRIENYGIVK